MKITIAMPFRIAAFCLAACAAKDPTESGDAAPDASVDGEPCAEGELAYAEDVSSCEPAPTDYMPRENGSADDTWGACISDDNAYHAIGESVASIARVEAYAQIGDLLWRNPAISPQCFIDARVIYEQEEGLGSRVSRRYDPHYPAPASGSCEEADVAAANPEYCVGPARLQPILVGAFAAGAEGTELVVNAARIQAALQWFLYISIIKESTTCAETPDNCDSAWAYYGGGAPRETPIGLAADIDGFAPGTHDRAYDGVLAVRCWRDLDPAVPAADLEMQAQAIAQLDFALLRGVAILERQKFVEIGCATGDFRDAALAWLHIVNPLLDRETRMRDMDTANGLLSALEGGADLVDVGGATSMLDATYPCP
jgi:hypothetical protein